MHSASDLQNPTQGSQWTLVSGSAFTSINDPTNSYLNTTNHWVITRQISATNPVPASGYDVLTEINGAQYEEIQSSTFAYRYAAPGVSAAVNYNVLNTTSFQAPALTPSTNGSQILQRVFVSPSTDLIFPYNGLAEQYEDQFGNFVLFNYNSSISSLFVEPFGVDRMPELVTTASTPASATQYGPWDFASYSQAPPGGSTPPPTADGPGGAWTVLLPGQE